MRSSPLFVGVTTALIFVTFAAFAHASKESVSCFYFPGRNYTSARVIKSQVSANAYGCCKLCDETAGCTAATYISKTYKCVMVADNTQYTDNVKGLVGVQNKDLTPQPTPQPTLQPTPAPTPSRDNGNIGVLTCCLRSVNCSVFSDRTCTSYGSECGKCVNGIPYDQMAASGYLCPHYNKILPGNISNVSYKSYRYDCSGTNGLKIKVFNQPDCPAAPSGVAETGWDSCSQNQWGLSQGSIIVGPPTSTPSVSQKRCLGLKCQSECLANKFVPGVCSYGRGDNYVIAQYYKSAKKVTYATYGKDSTCQNSTHAMLVEPEGACFENTVGYWGRNDAAAAFGKI